MKLKGKNLKHLSSITHDGKVLLFGTDTSGVVWYTIKQDGFEDSALDTTATNTTGFEKWQKLPLGQAQDDASALIHAQKELSDNNGDPLLTPIFGTSDAVIKSAQSPIKLVSDLEHLYIFRMSTASKLIANRFILDGMKNELLPKLDVRYRRSRQKYQPDTNMGLTASGDSLESTDTLGFRNMDGKSFYEPATELSFIQNLSSDKPWFSVVLLPTQEKERSRWNIFVYDTTLNDIVLYSVRSSEEGLFDIKDFSIPQTDPKTAKKVMTHKNGLIKRHLNLQNYTVTESFDATMYNEQAERATKAGMQLLKEATRVMLAVPVQASGQTTTTTVAISFGAAVDGTLSRIDLEPDSTTKLRGKTRELLLPLDIMDGVKVLVDSTPPPSGTVKQMSRGRQDRLRIHSTTPIDNLKTGQRIKLSDTKSYDGHYIATAVSENEFEIEAVFTNNETGHWEMVPEKETGLVFDNMIVGYEKTEDGKLRVKCTSHNLQEGDEVQVSGTADYNGLYPVKQVGTDNSFLLNLDWTKGEIMNLRTTKRRGLRFDGNSDYVRTHGISMERFNPNVNSGKTLSAWVWLEEYKDQPQLIAALDDDSLEISVNSDNKVEFKVQFNDKSFHSVQDPDVLPLKTWVHYAGVVDYKIGDNDNTTTNLYLCKNGAKVTPVAATGEMVADNEKIISDKRPSPPLSEAFQMGGVKTVTETTTETIMVTQTQQGAIPMDGIIKFNGADSYMELGSGIALPNTYTKELWLYPEATDNGYKGILGDNSGVATDRGPSLYLYDRNRLHGGFAGFKDGWLISWVNWTTGPVLTMNAWNHVAVVFNGTDTIVYVNGTSVLVHNMSGANPIDYKPVKYLGSAAGGDYFPGRIQELRLWNVARSQTQIQTNMNQRLSGNKTGLLANYQFEKFANRAIINHANNSKNGTMKNSFTFEPIPTGLTINGSYEAQVPQQQEVTRDIHTNDAIVINKALPAQRLSLAFWVKTGTNANADLLCYTTEFTRSDNTYEVGSRELAVTHPANLKIYIGNTTTEATGVSVNDGQWHHIALSWDSESGTLSLYKNGKEAYTKTDFRTGYSLPQGNDATLLLGVHGTTFFEGSLGQLSLWREVLTPETILQFRSLRLTGDEAGLEGLWVHGGDKVCDLSNRQVHGTFYGEVLSEAIPALANQLHQPRIWVGGNPSDKGFDGKLSDLQFWETGRSATIIKDSMYLLLKGNEQGLAGNWRLGGIAPGEEHRITPDFSVHNRHAYVYGDVYVSACELARNNDIGKAVKYTNEELVAVTKGATYKETFEFRVHKPDDSFMDTMEINNADGAGNKLFKFAYWGRSSRMAKKKVDFPDSTIQMNDFQSVGNGWHQATCTFTVPQSVTMIRSFEIDDVRGQWTTETQRPANEWDYMEVRKHRIELISDAINLAHYTDNLNLTALTNQQTGMESSLEEITVLESEIGELKKQLTDVLLHIDVVNNRAKYEGQKTQLESNIGTLESQKIDKENELNGFPLKYEYNIKNKGSAFSLYRYYNGDLYARQGYNGSSVKWGFVFMSKSGNDYLVQLKDTQSGKFLWYNDSGSCRTSDTGKTLRLVNNGGGNYKLYDTANNRALYSVASNYHGYFVFTLVNMNSQVNHSRAVWNLSAVRSNENAFHQNNATWYNAVEDLKDELNSKRELLTKLTAFLNSGESLSDLNTKKSGLEGSISTKESSINQKNTNFLTNLNNTQQNPQAMPLLQEDTYKLKTYGAALGFAQPLTGIRVIETAEGNVQLSYFDQKGRMRLTNYDATADSRNNAYQQWTPDGLRACPEFRDSADKLSLDNEQTISLQDGQWSVEARFYYPCPTKSDGSHYPYNVFTDSQDGQDQLLAVRDGKRLGTMVKGFFHDSGYDLESNLATGWHHIAAVGKNNDTYFYINGQPIVSPQKQGKKSLRYALQLNGTQEAIKMTAFPMPEDAITIAFWVRTNQATGTLLSYAQSSQMQMLKLADAGNLKVYLRGTSCGTTDVMLNDDKWHHIALTWSKTSGTLQLYKDGKEVFAKPNFKTGLSLDANGTMVIGQHQGSLGGTFSAPFQGQLSGLSVWNTARSVIEIEKDMYSILQGSETNLKGYWPMNFKTIGGTQQLEDRLSDDAAQHHGELIANPKSIILEDQSASDVAVIGNAKNGSSPIGRMAEFRLWNTALTDEEVAVNSKIVLSGYEPGLAVYYPMDEATGSQVRDRSATDPRHATLSRNNWVACSMGNTSCSVMDFDGTDDYIDCGAIDLANKSFTVECWAKRASTSGAPIIVGHGIGSTNQGLHLSFRSTGNFTFAFWGNPLDTAATYADSNWHHWACTYDAATGKRFIYRDGIKIAEDISSSPYEGNGNFRIGVLGSTNKFQGAISEVRLWDHARTQEQVQTYMKSRIDGDEAGLKGYWRLDVNGGGNAKDRSKEHHNGVIYGAKIKTTTELPIVEGQELVTAEYSTVNTISDSTKKTAMMRRFLAYSNRSGTVSVFSGQRIEDLELKWIGNAQFNPTLLGYMEGPPPVPSENLTIGYDYDGATSVELSQSQDTSYSWTRSTDTSLGVDLNLFLGAAWSMEAGFGVLSKMSEGKVGFRGMFNYSSGTHKESTIRAESSNLLADRQELRGNYEDSPRFAHLGRRYVPKNVGYALVVSGMADVFILKMKRSGKMIAYKIAPAEGMPMDVNTITFMMNPAYVLNGSLDGLVGSEAADPRFYRDTPEMRTQYGSLYPASYYRLKEAYDLKEQIDRWDKQREAYFINFDATKAKAEDLTSQTAEESEYDQYGQASVNSEENAVPNGEKTSEKEIREKQRKESQAQKETTSKDGNKKKAEIQKKISDPQKRSEASAAFDTWQRRMENLQIRAAKRNIVNTYVWDADGGMRSEEQNFANTIEHTVGGNFSMSWSAGAELDLMVVGFKLELTALAQGEMTQTMSKALSTSQGFQLNVDVSGLESKGITDSKDYPMQPGEKVDRYRFMSYYLEGNTRNYHDFFNHVVDPEWLQSNDEEARALRQAMAGDPNKAWRVLHRVTYVERPALMGMGLDLRKTGSVDEAAEEVLDYFDKLDNSNKTMKASVSQLQTLLTQLTGKVDDVTTKMDDVTTKLDELQNP